MVRFTFRHGSRVSWCARKDSNKHSDSRLRAKPTKPHLFICGNAQKLTPNSDALLWRKKRSFFFTSFTFRSKVFLNASSHSHLCHLWKSFYGSDTFRAHAQDKKFYSPFGVIPCYWVLMLGYFSWVLTGKV